MTTYLQIILPPLFTLAAGWWAWCAVREVGDRRNNQSTDGDS